MLNDPKSHGLWERTAPAAPATRTLGEHGADVVIVGAGFTGTSAALHLAEAGARVAVVEGAAIGFGGSGRNVGLVNAGMWTMPDDLEAAARAALRGTSPHDARRRAAAGVRAGRPAPHRLRGRARGHAPLRRRRGGGGRTRRARPPVAGPRRPGRAARLPTPHAADRHRRATRPPCSTAAPARSSRSPMSAASPRRPSRPARRSTPASPVTGVERDGTRWRVATAGGTVRADWIVVATNAYTRAPWPRSAQEIVHLPYFNIATRPLSSNLARSILPERQGLGHAGDPLLVPPRPGRPARPRQRRRAERDGHRDPPPLGARAACGGCSRSSATSRSRPSGTARSA